MPCALAPMIAATSAVAAWPGRGGVDGEGGGEGAGEFGAVSADGVATGRLMVCGRERPDSTLRREDVRKGAKRLTTGAQERLGRVTTAARQAVASAAESANSGLEHH